jgi:drug/metabolite transporter superfamily protein YnfA
MAERVRKQGVDLSVRLQKACEIVCFFVVMAHLRLNSIARPVWISCTGAKLHLYKSLTTVQKVAERGPDE